MGVSVRHSFVCGKSNGRVRRSVCTFGTSAWKTNTLPLHIEILFNEFKTVPAFAVSAILVIMAVIILIIRSVIEYKGKKES